MDNLDVLMADVRHETPTLWVNSQMSSTCLDDVTHLVSQDDFQATAQNWQNFAPLLEALFPELQSTSGVIDSQLLPVPNLQTAMGCTSTEYGQFYLKADHALPIAGSIKARGGFYEVLMHAKVLAEDVGFLSPGEPITKLATPAAKAVFADYTIAVGSTGNLGLSIGLAARALGFQAVVHMSHDAKAWKVQRLRDIGAEVVQHPTDYASAVDVARRHAAGDPAIYFVDDERSTLLFLGYSTAALRLKDQLASQGVTVDAEHPLFLYLPCGIGGAPGGIAYGAKVVFGEHVHCFFAEPTQSPCALVQMAHGLDVPVSVYDVGLHNTTEADGLAVGLMSQFVARVMAPMLSGVFTVKDDDLFRWLYLSQEAEGLRLEPSAAAGFAGPSSVLGTKAGQAYVHVKGLHKVLPNATHILWATGGSLVPEQQYMSFWNKGRKICEAGHK